MQYPHILSRNALTLYVSGVARTIHSDDSRWERALELLRAGDGEALADLMQPAKVVQQVLDGGMGNATGIQFANGQLYIDGQLLDENDYTVRQILDFHQQGLPHEPLARFYQRLQKNPSFRVRRDLLKFLEVGQLPITDDGHFMAYKRVNSDFTDVYSGRVNYTPGSVVSMPRERVDDDPNHTCSAGLHVCSYGYLGHFAPGLKVISVKVDPADVVSIPTDYNNTKMRVCQLTSVEEIPEPDRQNVWDTPVVMMERYDGCSCEDEDDEEFEPKYSLGLEVMINRPNCSTNGKRGIICDVDRFDASYPYQVQIVGVGEEPMWYREENLKPLPVPQPEGPTITLPNGDVVKVGDELQYDGTGTIAMVEKIHDPYRCELRFRDGSGGLWFTPNMTRFAKVS